MNYIYLEVPEGHITLVAISQEPISQEHAQAIRESLTLMTESFMLRKPLEVSYAGVFHFNHSDPEQRPYGLLVSGPRLHFWHNELMSYIRLIPDFDWHKDFTFLPHVTLGRGEIIPPIEIPEGNFLIDTIVFKVNGEREKFRLEG